MAISKGAQSTFGNQDGNNTTATVSGAIDSTGAGLLIAFVSFEGAPETGGAITDSKGNTSWTEVARRNHGNGDMTSVMYAKFAPAVGTSHTVTYTPGAARPFKYCGFKAVNGSFANSSAIDGTPLVNSGNGTAYDAGTLNTTATALIVQWNVNYAGDNQSTPAGSWVSGDEDLEIPGRQVISKVQTGSVSNFDPTTTGVVAVDWNAICADFIEVSGGGTINTQTLTDTLVIGDLGLASTIFPRTLSDTLTVSEVSIASKVYGVLFSDEITADDQGSQFAIRTRITESDIVVTDELLASIIGNAILVKVLSDSIDITDGTIWSAIRGRILQDTISLSEGVSDFYTTTNMVVDDTVLIDDANVARQWLTRLLTENINVTDEAIASIIGQNVLQRILSDSIDTVDQAVLWCQRQRLGESSVLTTDELIKVLRWTRELTDSVELSDESLSTFKRFVMLTDALTVNDDAIAALVGQATYNPLMRIGFDQPDIDIGGYSLN